MDVEPKQDGDGERLFRDSERTVALAQAQAAVRQIEEAAAAKAAQIERLERAVGELAGLDEEPEPDPEPAPAAGATYLVFLGTPSGYVLHEARGDVFAAGGRVALEGVEHLVAKVGRSPLPGDDRRCAYLEPA
jgi:hypothetical protein